MLPNISFLLGAVYMSRASLANRAIYKQPLSNEIGALHLSPVSYGTVTCEKFKYNFTLFQNYHVIAAIYILYALF